MYQDAGYAEDIKTFKPTANPVKTLDLQERQAGSRILVEFALKCEERRWRANGKKNMKVISISHESITKKNKFQEVRDEYA